MFTEDDKYERSNSHTSYLDTENIYADYYDNDIEENSKKNYKYHDNYDYNKDIDTSYDDEDEKYTEPVTVDSVKKKKYGVIIIFLIIILCILLVILYKSLVIQDPVVAEDTYINFFQSSVEVKLGENKKLDLTLNNVGSNYTIQWFSNNDNIVSVDQNGNITAIQEGKAEIMAIYSENNVIKSETKCEIQVIKQ